MPGQPKSVCKVKRKSVKHRSTDHAKSIKGKINEVLARLEFYLGSNTSFYRLFMNAIVLLHCFFPEKWKQKCYMYCEKHTSIVLYISETRQTKREWD